MQIPEGAERNPRRPNFVRGMKRLSVGDDNRGRAGPTLLSVPLLHPPSGPSPLSGPLAPCRALRGRTRSKRFSAPCGTPPPSARPRHPLHVQEGFPRVQLCSVPSLQKYVPEHGALTQSPLPFQQKEINETPETNHRGGTALRGGETSLPPSRV